MKNFRLIVGPAIVVVLVAIAAVAMTRTAAGQEKLDCGDGLLITEIGLNGSRSQHCGLPMVDSAGDVVEMRKKIHVDLPAAAQVTLGCIDDSTGLNRCLTPESGAPPIRMHRDGTIAGNWPETWWILANDQSKWGSAPNALGPYPSAELCRIAGHAAMPYDDQFKTTIQIEKDKRAAAVERARQNAAIAAAPHDKDGWARTKEYGSFHFNAKGEIDGQAVSGGGTWDSVHSGPSYSAITGCVKVDSPK